MPRFDYEAIGYNYGVSKRDSKRIFAKSLDIVRKMMGDIPQEVIEKEYYNELVDIFNDLLSNYDNKYKENQEKTKEKINMKGKTMIREYLEDSISLDQLVNDYPLDEEETYSQAMINPNTVRDEACKGKKKRKEYAIEGKGANTGDLDGESGYGTSYAPDGENAYSTRDDKNEILDMETAYATSEQQGADV